MFDWFVVRAAMQESSPLARDKRKMPCGLAGKFYTSRGLFRLSGAKVKTGAEQCTESLILRRSRHILVVR